MKIDICKSMPNELQHYGILGMKWGIRRSPEELGYKALTSAKTANLDKWGKDEDHNILYVTGYSGSGKSTLARGLKDPTTNVIHLDTYFEKLDKNVASSFHDKDFKSYIETTFPEYINIPDMSSKSKGKWDALDAFMEKTEDFARQQFNNGKKVIVEGVQLQDETVYPDKTFFEGKPIAITGSKAIVSFLRASERDERSLITGLSQAKEYVQWYNQVNENLKVLSDITGVEKGSEYVTNLLKKSGD